jgi:prevent-host-death family protein
MSQVTISDAAQRLSELVNESQAGQEVILMRDGEPVARIVPFQVSRPKPQRDSGKDFIDYIAPDFNAIPEAFEDYMP